MGNDTPLAVLSDAPAHLLYDYFKQLFAQVTNPPIDAIREELVTSLVTILGAGNLFTRSPRALPAAPPREPRADQRELARSPRTWRGRPPSGDPPALFPCRDGRSGLEKALDRAPGHGAPRDRGRASDPDPRRTAASTPSIAPIPEPAGDRRRAPPPGARGAADAGAASSSRPASRARCMHFALLIGYGASAVNPYLAFETLDDMVARGRSADRRDARAALDELHQGASNKGLLKIMSKMGISTLQSYRGAQIFEAVGLDRELVDSYFTGTASRIDGIGLDVLAREADAARHGVRSRRRPRRSWTGRRRPLPVAARRRDITCSTRETIAKLQQRRAATTSSRIKEYAALVNDQSRELCTLRGLLEFKPGDAGPARRGRAGRGDRQAVLRPARCRFGSISKEAHETLAIAMNRIGGEVQHRRRRRRRGALHAGRRTATRAQRDQAGGLRPLRRDHRLPRQRRRSCRSRWRRAPSPARAASFPATRSTMRSPRVRHSTPGVTLISPPPHHDIYSIEDLAQLIYDLKNANPRRARLA